MSYTTDWVIVEMNNTETSKPKVKPGTKTTPKQNPHQTPFRPKVTPDPRPKGKNINV